MRIGVSKPLPVTEGGVAETTTEEEAETTPDNTELQSAVSDMETDPGKLIDMFTWRNELKYHLTECNEAMKQTRLQFFLCT